MCGSMSPFRSFFTDVSPIVMREPLAGFLGAFEQHRSLLEYSFDDVVKMAGHACPTVASAFVCCKKALARLHDGDIPERGNIAVTVHAEQDDKTFGVMAQVFSLVTGACGPTGFKGLGHKFRRKDLLSFEASDADGGSMDFTFSRLDNGKKVKARIFPDRLPAVEGQEKLGDLMEKAFWEAASHEEVHEFQDLWMERVKAIVLEERDLDTWLSIEPA